MIRVLILLFFVSLSPDKLIAQGDPGKQNGPGIAAMEADSMIIVGCLDRSAYYLFQDNKLDIYLDSAWMVLKHAQELASENGNEDFLVAVSAMLGSYYVVRGEWIRGSKMCKKAIEYYHSKKDYLSAAHCWHRLGNSIDDSTLFYSEQKLHSFDNARNLFIQLKLPLNTAETLQDIAICHAKQGRFDTAEAIMRKVISIYRPLDKAKMLDAYDALAEVSEYQNDQHKQLKYRLELIEQMESTEFTSRAADYYSQLAITYANISMYEESLATILKTLSIIKETREYDDFYGDLSLAIFNYIKLGKPEAALKFLLTEKNEVPPQNLAHTVDLHDMLGKCYAALNEPGKAEYHFLMMMKLFNSTQNTSLYSTRKQQLIDFIHYNQVIGDFYVGRKQFKKAGVYYKKILKLPAGQVRPITLSKVHLMQFRVDSAAHNFIAAINHYIIYKQLQDSLFALARNQQLHELNIKYETAGQVRDLQLKQQSIASLTAQTRLQKAELKRESFTSNIILISSLLLLSIAYLGYRFKQRHNFRLQEQQQEINAQNIQLRSLLDAQKNLVAEKEWLLKEVHHRVKNNLHTIISLLETQATFLSDDALVAIQNSQHRIYAMSLIHQKLYQFENSTQINMAVYLPELLQYLQDSFGVRSRILFQANYDNVELDITQAIPIGLIFNEAITNAIKYAFPDNSIGCIKISMTNEIAGNVRLSISDNGVGLPSGWKDLANNTFGLKLMQGLSEDIHGSFRIETNNGTRVLVEFAKLDVLNATKAQEE